MDFRRIILPHFRLVTFKLHFREDSNIYFLLVPPKYLFLGVAWIANNSDFMFFCVSWITTKGTPYPLNIPTPIPAPVGTRTPLRIANQRR